MILRDKDLIEWGYGGGVAPFYPDNVNPASIDLTLADTFRWSDGGKLITDDVMDLVPGLCLLCSTVERVRLPDDVAGLIVLKSSLARRGLAMAGGWVDPGWDGVLTIALHCTAQQAAVYAGERFVQLVLMRLTGPSSGYDGRYQLASVPLAEIIGGLS